MFLVKVQIKLKSTVNDPEGQTILEAMHRLNHKEISSVRTGKYFEIIIDSNDDIEVSEKVKKVCDDILTNPIVETYTYEIIRN
ncbi:MAG: phosphoribosylformylglycinamidine synthase [Chloroflexi bacterium]|nr:phosphoribosylformylglycinamidine synthase [Chloroflexota bacterium]|tara:strand:+ start:227 stop:475 length:249 start_codon:yes stop_codon:yes gene_type:complete